METMEMREIRVAISVDPTGHHCDVSWGARGSDLLAPAGTIFKDGSSDIHVIMASSYEDHSEFMCRVAIVTWLYSTAFRLLAEAGGIPDERDFF